MNTKNLIKTNKLLANQGIQLSSRSSSPLSTQNVHIIQYRISSLLNLGKVENPQRSKLPQIEAKKPTLAKKDIRSRSSSVQSIDGEVTVEEFVLEMVKLPIDFEIFMILLLTEGGTYPQLPTQPNFLYTVQTNTVV